jgi:hypothetical protein
VNWQLAVNEECAIMTRESWAMKPLGFGAVGENDATMMGLVVLQTPDYDKTFYCSVQLLCSHCFPPLRMLTHTPENKQ